MFRNRKWPTRRRSTRWPAANGWRNASGGPRRRPSPIRRWRARADLVFAKHRQSLLTITAPASGAVARLRVRIGDDVYTRDPLADVADPSTVRVQAQIAPELFRFVHAGAAADVRVLTIPPHRFREPVARVIAAGSEGGPAIIVNVPNPDRMMQPGTPAIVTLQ